VGGGQGRLPPTSAGSECVRQVQTEAIAQKKEEVRRKLRERRVPSSPFGRVMGFAQLGASLVYGTMSDSVSNYFAPKSAEQDSQKPSNRCVATTCQNLLIICHATTVMTIKTQDFLANSFSSEHRLLIWARMRRLLT